MSYAKYGCTPEQYHAGLDKLWAAMPQYQSPTDEDVFTLAADEIERLRAVVSSAIAYKASLLQTISSRPPDEQDKPMQGRMVLRAEFVSACEQYEAAREKP